jgi:hypothetical protein
MLNPLCCHWHEFNLAGLSSAKNLTGQAQIGTDYSEYFDSILIFLSAVGLAD